MAERSDLEIAAAKLGLSDRAVAALLRSPLGRNLGPIAFAKHLEALAEKRRLHSDTEVLGEGGDAAEQLLSPVRPHAVAQG